MQSCHLPGSSIHPLGLSRQGYWSGLPFPSPGDLPDPGIEPGSPAGQADSLPSEPQGMETYLKDILKVVISSKQYNMKVKVKSLSHAESSL